MNRSIVLSGVAAALGLAALSAPMTASASCSDRKTTGTIVGGIGGALIGNSIAGGGGGAILGGLGGAVAGHAIAGSTCGRYRHAYYDRGRYSDRGRYYGSRTYGAGGAGYRGSGYATPTRTVYYDARGNPLSAAEPAGYSTSGYASNRYASNGYAPAGYSSTGYGAAGCGVDRSYYDSRGNLVQQPAIPCR